MVNALARGRQIGVGCTIAIVIVIVIVIGGIKTRRAAD